MDPIQRVLEAIGEYRAAGENNWTARCPAHEDRTPSLSISIGEGGRVLLKCHAGCPTKEVLAAIGLEMRHLFPEPDRANGRTKNGANGAAKKQFPDEAAAIAALQRTRGTPAKIWRYQDAQGNPTGAVIRWQHGDRKEILPIARRGDAWVIGAMPRPRPLYQVPRLLAASAAQVAVVEGEKAADAAAAIGLLATTSAGGAEAAKATDWGPLAGREVLILPDADGPGEKYAGQVAQILLALEPPAKVKIVRLPGLAPESGDDLFDFAARRREDGKEPTAIKQEIEDLAASSPEQKLAPARKKRTAVRYIHQVIQDYFQRRYQTTFRRGPSIWSNALGREITRAEACTALPSDLIDELMRASDYPSKNGACDRSVAPGEYRKWAPTAWADLHAALPDEADSPEIADGAAEDFQAAVRDALLTVESLAYQRQSGKDGRTEVQRRSLIEWCRIFAKPGPWAAVRSFKLWCRLGQDGGLEVAIHAGLFGQLRKGTLTPASHRRFAELAEIYGVGSPGRTSRSRFVELSPTFVSELLAGPCDGRCDDDGDAAPHAGARSASSSPSHLPSHEGYVLDVEEAPMEAPTEGQGDA